MEHNQEKALHLLGIARKANRLAIGEEPAGIACRSGKARLLLVAQDAGEHTVRRAQSFCRSGKPAWMQVGFTKETGQWPWLQRLCALRRARSRAGQGVR